MGRVRAAAREAAETGGGGDLPPHGEQRRAAGVYAIAERLLDAHLVVETMAVDHLDNEVATREHTSVVVPNEVVVSRLIEEIAGEVFRLGACLQTDPQLEEVGSVHGGPPFSQQIDVVGP